MAQFIHSEVLRAFDANANRSREALRVLEDYARFSLNHTPLCEQLKQLRHELTQLLKPWLPEALLHRDTPADVGVTNKTPAELQRNSLDDVVTAAGKRLGEALRVLEELAKTFDAPLARDLEQARYRFYSIEQAIGRTLGRSPRFRSVRLYVLITEQFCQRPWLDVARACIEGGADCLQLREKSLEGSELLDRASRLVEVCRQADVLCIVNDRLDVALLANADGVHLGQQDLPADHARRLVGPGRIIGVSTHCLEHARKAVLDGADYIGVGPVFPSPTKPRDILPGLDYARAVAREIRIPGVAIAGITPQNVAQVWQTGIQAIAVTQAITLAPDPASACRALKSS